MNPMLSTTLLLHHFVACFFASFLVLEENFVFFVSNFLCNNSLRVMDGS